MIGYKGFDKNFRCRDMQYQVGQTYSADGQLKICENGLHFCDTPTAVFEFYPPADCRFAVVEALGSVVSHDKNPHKFCTDRLKIIRELSLIDFVAEVKDSATNTGNCSAATNTGNCSAATNTGNWSAATNTGNWSAATNTGNCSAATNTGNCSAATNTGFRSAAINTGDYSAATNTGFRSAATNTGFRSVAINTGDYSAATVEGDHSVAVVTGRASKAKANIGSWLVLSEWQGDIRSDVQVFKVDGEKILPDTFYRLKDGKPVEVQEDNQ